MTDKEKSIIKNIKSRVRKYYGKWVVKTDDVNWAIAKAMYGEKYGAIDGWHTMTKEECDIVKTILDKMIEKGLVRYTIQPHAAYKKAHGKIWYDPCRMVIEKRFWDLYNQVKEA